MTDWKSLFGTERPVALVTGSGAPRMGNVVAQELAARGFRLVIHANKSFAQAKQTAELFQARGTEALALQADLTDEPAVQTMVSDTLGHFGRIDAWVNCAAIWKMKPLEKTCAADVRNHFDANTLSTFLCCQSAGLAMVGQPHGGAIVNLGDWAVARPYLNYSAYFPSKGAIDVLTRNFAVELAARNPRVRVNAVLPGPVMLPADLPEQEKQRAIAGTLVKREGSPRHVAAAVLHLIENDFITGVCLPVDGGRTIAGAG